MEETRTESEGGVNPPFGNDFDKDANALNEQKKQRGFRKIANRNYSEEERKAVNRLEDAINRSGYTDEERKAAREAVDELISGKTPVEDNVNHPDHYNVNGIECIDAMIASQGVTSVIQFCICNSFKYIWRHSHKGKLLEDLGKADWYLNKAITLIKWQDNPTKVEDLYNHQ